MIDKLWYDWQCRDPSNKNAFGGGSISAQVDPSQAAAYPTGAPPLLSVRDSQCVLCITRANVQQLDSVIPGDGLWGNTTVREVMNTKAGRLCYVYA